MPDPTVVVAVAVACGPLVTGARAQWSESFDSYATGSAIVGQGGWEMWGGGAAPHGIVSSAQALSVPHSLEVINGDDIVQQYDISSGVWEYRANMFIDAEASGAESWFVLLNNFPAKVNPDWSVAVVCNPNDGIVTSWDGSVLPLITGAWAEFRVVINLDADMQDIYYGGDLLVSKSWSGGVAEGGLVHIGAVDLYAPDAGFNTYWDDLSLAEVDPIGACCLFSGECIPDLEQADCEAMPGYYKYNGIGSTCASALCPAYVAGEGWQVTAPLEWNGDTTLQVAECSFGSNDEIFAVEIPYDGPWTFSLCAGTSFDTYLALGSAPCGEDLATNDDGCGVQSEIQIPLEAGTYYVSVTSLFGEEGAYQLVVDAPCIASVETAGDPESEACGADSNGGCNMTVPAFEPIALGQTIAGTNWYDGATRDTDWYEFTNQDGLLRWAFIGRPFDEDILLCDSGYNDYEVTIEQAAPGADTNMIVTCENVTVFGMIADADGNPSTDCALVSGISPFFQTDPCGGEATVMGLIEAGAACSPTNGDTNDDGIVDVSDLLNVLADWGCSGAPGACLGDVNCDGVTNVSDLLDVLANWD